MKNYNSTDTDHIDILDGVRVLAVLIVVWFHFWQQSWLMPIGFGINLDWLPRAGYQMVDMFILLSGFCLFLPHARAMLLGTPVPDKKTFYKKRVARIVPSYLFSILFILFVFALPNGEYTSMGEMLKDLVSHLTFSNVFFHSTHMNTKLNFALWTVVIEVQFYILFPWIADCFRKRPFWTYGIMSVIAFVFNGYITKNAASLNFSMFMNQLPTFLGVYANGMMGALIFVQLQKTCSALKQNTTNTIALNTVNDTTILNSTNDTATLNPTDDAVTLNPADDTATSNPTDDTNNNISSVEKKPIVSQNPLRYISFFFSILSISCIWIYKDLISKLLSSNTQNVTQVEYRFAFSILYLVFIISLGFSFSAIRFLFANKVIRFLSSISFNLYIWHQIIAVKLKDYRIPYWEGDTPPNMTGDKAWQWQYTILICIVSFAVAVIVTYGIEKPMAKLILKKKKDA